jgi:N-glycosylation protein
VTTSVILLVHTSMMLYCARHARTVAAELQCSMLSRVTLHHLSNTDVYVLCIYYTILCMCACAQMKLISYAHCNRDVRLAWHEAAAAKQKEQAQQHQQQQQQHTANTNSKHSSSNSKASPPRIRYESKEHFHIYKCVSKNILIKHVPFMQ